MGNIIKNWPSSLQLQKKVCFGVILKYDDRNETIHCIDSQTPRHIIDKGSFKPFLNFKSSQITKNVISLIGIFDDAYFHFPAEYAWHLYLQNFSKDDIKNCKIIIRKTDRVEFKKQWIKIIFPFVKEDSFIFLESDKSINCINLIPVGRFCGIVTWKFYTKPEIKSIRDMIIKNLDLSNTNSSSLLLIKRNHTRTLKNWDKVYKICKKYCEEYNLKLEVFDDSRTLGDVSSQLKKFNSAKIVVGCHGAGFTNIISCIEGTYFIEFMSRELRKNSGLADQPCFKRLAGNLDLKYNALDKTKTEGVDIKKFSDILFNITKE
jgi:hypothetical protein